MWDSNQLISKSFQKFTIQILEKLRGNGYRNGVDSQLLGYRLQREDSWMTAIKTIYRYGVNYGMCTNKPKDKVFQSLRGYEERYLYLYTRKHPVHNKKWSTPKPWFFY